MNEEKILDKLIEHGERLEKIEDRLETMPTKDELFSKLDSMVTILQRLDQERVFTTEWIRRIETDVEKIKRELHIV